MKSLLLTTLLLFALLSKATADDKKLQTLKNVARVEEAVSFVFVDLKNNFDGTFEYEPRGESIKVDAGIRQMLVKLSEVSLHEQYAPWIGFLDRVAVLDQDGKAICILEVINSDATFSVADAKTTAGKIINAGKPIYLQGHSPEFAKWMYESLKKREPNRIKDLEKFYAKHDLVLEELLFGKTKPANKTEQDKR
ncbi:MAG: hypothetical protein AB7I98_14925 [Verrucomicrobiales bacterium]